MTESTPHNLLTAPWLPVRLRDGRHDVIRLAELGRDDIVDIEAPRADFRGAIYQLLIGLLQTAFAPTGRKDWIQHWQYPPDSETLAQAFSAYEPAFNIDASAGEPAFMQDLELEEGEQKDIAALLIEAPGAQTIRNNQDHAFPTPVGMNRSRAHARPHPLSVPHTRGDEPLILRLRSVTVRHSPQRWE